MLSQVAERATSLPDVRRVAIGGVIRPEFQLYSKAQEN